MKKRALLCIDAQKDFMPVSEKDYKNDMGGALAVPDGDKILPIINSLIPLFDLVIFTKDWHDINNIYFAETHNKEPFTFMEINGKTETLWPVHCVKETRGAQLHDDINISLVPNEMFIIKKGISPNCHPYSGFGDKMENTELEELLKDKGVNEVYITGLAGDFCVKDTAIDAVNKGFDTNVIIDGVRFIDPDKKTSILSNLTKLNIKIINSYELI